ncbi:MAG: AAA family ATPase [Oligoflexia bacterium]|nr:AAA family ATPase [Oligoflexia bacterium]
MDWKGRPGRLPLLLRGARQVGKSTLIQAFGEGSFPGTHVLNFQQDPRLRMAFSGELKPAEILKALELLTAKKIAAEDLIFFDEIQDCAEAVTSLKYFAEELPRQAVIAAGSHLGLIKNEAAFPVGKVEFLSLHPLTFFEFLGNFEAETRAYFEGQALVSEAPFAEFYHQRALHWLRLYLCVGGMPGAVTAFVAMKGREPEAARAAREVQKGLIEGYYGDFAKHAGTVNANHILRVFQSCAVQLGRTQDESVSRFKFSGVIPRKKGFEAIDGPLTWLERSRLVIKTHLANRLEQPIRAFTQPNTFKVYLLDVGLLNAMLDVPTAGLLLGGLGTYSGYLAENFVAQELFARLDQSLCGWTESDSEVEFVISRDEGLCPVEVKASSRSRRAKSLDALIARYHPELAIKLTGQNRGRHAARGILTLPIYLAGRVAG